MQCDDHANRQMTLSPSQEGRPFVTGFVADNESVWGRPAGVAVTRDGALLVSDDANGRTFRVARG